jgi:hypothetical protein
MTTLDLTTTQIERSDTAFHIDRVTALELISALAICLRSQDRVEPGIDLRLQTSLATGRINLLVEGVGLPGDLRSQTASLLV